MYEIVQVAKYPIHCKIPILIMFIELVGIVGFVTLTLIKKVGMVSAIGEGAGGNTDSQPEH